MPNRCRCIVLAIVLFALMQVDADFDFGGDCEGGSGSFEQTIPFRGMGVQVGTIPAGIKNVDIRMTSSVDIDVQLLVKDTASYIVQWTDPPVAPLGSQPSRDCATYRDLQYCYSGYNGDQTLAGRGNEWIKIDGTTNIPLEMRAWAYASAGVATVEYSWESSCTGTSSSGTGSFNQALEQDAVVIVGTIPVGIQNLQIALESNGPDVDIQLLDGDVSIVEWKPLVNDEWVGGLLGQSPNPASVEYEDMVVSYSGFNGFDGRLGSEYIVIDGTTTKELTIKAFGYQAGTATVNYAWGSSDVELQLDYVQEVSSPIVFDMLSQRDNVPGAIGIREVKFIIERIDNPTASALYLANTKKHSLHYVFARDGLGWTLSAGQFQSQSYWSDTRRNLVGSILYHASFVHEDGTMGVYTLEFWPLDPVATALVILGYNLIQEKMPNAKLLFHPVGDTQLEAYAGEEVIFENAGVELIATDALFASVTFAAMNPGRGLGFLRVVGPGDPAPSILDVVIFTFVPPDLNHVAGIITEAPQTPLSHINLKAKQNKTPNAYISNASQELANLIGQICAFTVTADGYDIVAATQADVDAWLESVRPDEPQIPQSDLSATVPTQLSDIRHADWIRYGAKAANVAELNVLFDQDTTVHTPHGYAVPFAMYNDFMTAPRCGDALETLCTGDSGTSLYDQARAMTMEATFENDPEARSQALKAFRDKIENSEASAPQTTDLENIRVFWDPQGPPYTTTIRCRSSTNNEDLEGFNGAGLYESKSHKPSEGNLINTVKEIWAGLWTLRAFDERNFYRIDHFQTYMGVLLHPSYGDEQANGVGVTKNIYNPAWEGYYINSQYGEISVTNPEQEDIPNGASYAIPDELLVSRLLGQGSQFSWEVQYIRHSNIVTIYDDQPVPTEDVLTPTEVQELRAAMQKIQVHFKPIYNGESSFAMDIEFKIMRTTDYDPAVGEQPARGMLSIKQARPWID